MFIQAFRSTSWRREISGLVRLRKENFDMTKKKRKKGENPSTQNQFELSSFYIRDDDKHAACQTHLSLSLGFRWLSYVSAGFMSLCTTTTTHGISFIFSLFLTFFLILHHEIHVDVLLGTTVYKFFPTLVRSSQIPSTYLKPLCDKLSMKRYTHTLEEALVCMS